MRIPLIIAAIVMGTSVPCLGTEFDIVDPASEESPPIVSPISFGGDAQDAKSGCEVDAKCGCADSCRWYLFPQSECGINVHGWIDAGFIWNTSSPTSGFNGPYNAVDRSNEIMMNQLYMVAEKGLPHCGLGIGGRIDFIYGEDYFLAESIGIEKRPDGTAHWNREYYGMAFPQAYVSVGNENLNMQVGHFYSVVGYEGVMSPDNFFYSKSLQLPVRWPVYSLGWTGQLAAE